MLNFPKNEHFLPPDTHTYVCVSGGKKCSFFGKFSVLCFLETHVSRFALFALLPDHLHRYIFWSSSKQRIIRRQHEHHHILKSTLFYLCISKELAHEIWPTGRKEGIESFTQNITFYRLETKFFSSTPSSDFRKIEISQDQKFFGSSDIAILEILIIDCKKC